MAALKEGRLSARMTPDVAERLDRRSARGSKSALVERYVDEGMRMDDHPGVIFRDGPTGRRAALTRGPDVWEVIGVVRDQPAKGDAAARDAAEWLGRAEAEVKIALGYYAEFTEEIDERLRLNAVAAREAEEAWKRGQAALS